MNYKMEPNTLDRSKTSKEFLLNMAKAARYGPMEPLTTATGEMALPWAKESSTMLMETFTLGSFLRTKRTAREFIFIKMDKNTMVIGKMTSSMDMEQNIWKMGQSMRECSKRGRNVEKASTSGQMGASTKANG